MHRKYISPEVTVVSLTLLGALLLPACASAPPRPVVPRDDLYDWPCEVVWREVQRFVQDQGFHFQDDPTRFELLTDPESTFGGRSMVSNVVTQLYVVGQKIDAEHCEIRIQRREQVSNTDDHIEGGSKALTTRRGQVTMNDARESNWGSRDPGMEKRLHAHVVARYAAEHPSAPDAAPTASAPQVPPAPIEDALPPEPQASTASTPSTPAAAPQPTAPPAGASVGTSWPQSCGREIRDAMELLKPGGFVLLGEMSGSREIPAMMGQLVCAATASGMPVLLALEIPRESQAQLNRFMASPGGEEDIRRLLNDSFWARDYQDGRSSQAILGLIQTARELRARKIPISLLAYDLHNADGTERQEQMAQRILAERRRWPRALTLVLTGNVQARTRGRTQWDRSFVPMGVYLFNADPSLKSVDAHYEPGSVWTCRAEHWKVACGERFTTMPRHRTSRFLDGAPQVVVEAQPSEADGYHGIIYVGRLTASPPALANR